MELLPIGVLDPVKVVQRVLDAQEQPSPQNLFTAQVQQTGQFQPPPDPKMLELQMKSQADQQKAAQDMQQQAFNSELQKRDQQFQHAMEAQKMDMQQKHEAIMTQIKASALLHQDQARVVGAAQKMDMASQEHQQTMQHNAQEHAQNLKNSQEIAKSKAQAVKTSKPGSAKK